MPSLLIKSMETELATTIKEKISEKEEVSRNTMPSAVMQCPQL